MFLGHYLEESSIWYLLIRPFGHILCCLYYHLQPFLVCFCSTGETLTIVTHTGLSHIDAGGHSPLRSPPAAPLLLPPPHLPWRWAGTLLLRSWIPKLTVRPAVLPTPWLLWQLKIWVARPQMAWGMAGLKRMRLKIRGAVHCSNTCLGGSYHCRREARTCQWVLEEATHRFHLAWFADPLWSPNAYPSQILRWGTHCPFFDFNYWSLNKMNKFCIGRNCQCCCNVRDFWLMCKIIKL